jgi:O-antigen ligase/tetratricopeptide (TPR) repeat protein
MKAKKHAKKAEKKQSKETSAIFFLFTGFLILFIPLFHLKQAMDITLMPRTFALSVFLLGFSLILLGKKHFHRFDFAPMRSWIFVAVLLYLLMTIASVVWASNPRESYFDMVRTTLFLLVMLYAAVIFNKTPDWQDHLPKMVLVTAIIALLIGLVQYYNKVFLNTAEMMEDGREKIYAVIGIMSHKNEFSTQLMLLIPLLGYGIYRFRKGWQVAFIITTLLTLVLILVLKTRAVWVGIAVATLVCVVMALINGHRLGMSRHLRMAAAALLLAGIIGMAWIHSLPDKPDDFSFIGRVKNITNTESQHNIHRINVWKATLSMIEENNHVKGVGAGNWQMLIAPYCKGMFSSISALNWGRPHNDFLWVWAEKGIFGLIFYLTFFTIAFIYLLRTFFLSPLLNDRVLALLLAGGILAYLAVSFFSFPYERINHTVFLALFMAVAVVMNQRINAPKPFNPLRALLLLIALITTSMGALYGWNAIQMEKNMKKTIQAENQGRYEEAIGFANQSKTAFRSLNPMAYPPEYYVAKSDYQIGKQLLSSGAKEAGMRRIEEALSGFEYTLTLFPGNVWTISRMGLIYNDLGTIYEAQGDTAKSNEYYHKMIRNLEYMIELVPALKQERKAMAGAWFKTGNYHKAKEVLESIPNYKKDKDVVTNIKGLDELIAKQETGDDAGR